MNTPLPSSGFRTFRLVTLVVAFAFLASLLIWSATRPRSQRDPAGAGLAIGKEAPPIDAAGWINGSPPEDWHEKPLVVEAWATRCGPCLERLPEMNKLANEYGDRVQFVGLTDETGRELPEVQRVIEQLGVDFLIGHGATETLEKLEVRYLPSVWVINQDGVVIWNGSRDEQESLEEAISRVADQPNAKPLSVEESPSETPGNGD